jgi:hypothetical protein
MDETVLWRLVLRQALWDLQAVIPAYDPNVHVKTTHNRERQARDRQSVISWLGTADFHAVCEMADVDPSYMEGKLRAEARPSCSEDSSVAR